MRLIALALLALAPPLALAQDPPPATIEQLIVRITDLRAKQQELAKQEAAAAADLKLRLKEQQDRLDKLGLSAPVPAPKPPEPKPPEPPADPLRARLAAAFKAAAGTDPEKREWAKDLAALYRAGVKVAGDPKYATAAQLKTKLRESAEVLLDGPHALKDVRDVVAGELGAVLPTTETDLTDAHRRAAVDLFTRLAAILDTM